jgi:hypothetical protein
MVQIDVPIAFGIGSLFADAASRQLRTGLAEHYYRAFSANLICQIFCFSWNPIYFLVNYFGWETTHMWWHADNVRAYPFYLPLFVVVFFAAAIGGFLLGHKLVRAGRLWANRAVYLGILVYSVGWVFLQTGSTGKLGTYREWKDGNAPWIYEDSTFLFMLIFTAVVLIIGVAVFASKLIAEGRAHAGAVGGVGGRIREGRGSASGAA